jgi:hypothetical protein
VNQRASRATVPIAPKDIAMVAHRRHGASAADWRLADDARYGAVAEPELSQFTKQTPAGDWKCRRGPEGGPT